MSLTAGCQSVTDVSEPLNAETIGTKARALCESASLQVGSMKYTKTNGAFTDIGLKCIGNAMSISWTEYAPAIGTFCEAAGNLSVRSIEIENAEDGSSSEVTFECQ